MFFLFLLGHTVLLHLSGRFHVCHSRARRVVFTDCESQVLVDDLAQKKRLKTKKALDLSPSCSSINYWCVELDMSILNAQGWPDVIVQGNARLAKHAARLKTRREGKLTRALDEDAEAKLVDIETRLAATEELILKNKRISDFEKQEKTQGGVPASSTLLLLPWMLVFALSFALLAAGSLQVCRARLKAFSGYKDMPDSERNSIGPGQIGNRT